VSARERLRGILLDMDGVLYSADNIIDGAGETAAWVRAQGIPHLFVTKTTSKSRVALADKLRSFGVPAQEEKILTPAAAAAEWLHAQGESGIALFVPPSARLEFAGLPCLPDDVESGASYVVVVGDLGKLWDYRTLNRAFRLLYHNPNAQLIALGMTCYWLARRHRAGCGSVRRGSSGSLQDIDRCSWIMWLDRGAGIELSS